MPRPKKEAGASAPVSVLILRDGVFVAEDVRRDKGDKCDLEPELAKLLIERGHAKPV